jgi:hypothetical protein
MLRIPAQCVPQMLDVQFLPQRQAVAIQYLMPDPHHERSRSSDQELPHPKKVGTLPVENSDEVKRTNEIKMAIPLLDAIDIQGKDISADALLTQRELAEYLVTERNAHYYFTVKGNQPGLLQDLEFRTPDIPPDLLRF